jgi:hypothetical protein
VTSPPAVEIVLRCDPDTDRDGEITVETRPAVRKASDGEHDERVCARGHDVVGRDGVLIR